MHTTSVIGGSLVAWALCLAACAHTESPKTASTPAKSEGERTYQALVQRAEAGEAIDFGDLRRQWLRTSGTVLGYGALTQSDREAMHKALRARDAAGALASARRLLAIAYVDLDAHDVRRQACEKLGDAACAARSEKIERALIDSIISTGDGFTCATSWKVVNIAEEYFVLQMYRVKFLAQALVQRDGRACDAMRGESEGKAITLYFDVGDVLQAEAAELSEGKP